MEFLKSEDKKVKSTISGLFGRGNDDCLFVLSINLAHYQSHGFEAKFAHLESSKAITAFETRPVDIYLKQDHDHSGGKALIVSFYKAP